MSDIELKVKNLKIKLKNTDGANEIVDDISFNLRKGETLGIVGKSGSGKSLTALSILGLLDSSNLMDISGKILYEGKNLLALTPNELNKIRGKKISIIFQDPMTSLDPLFTIENQLIEILKLHQQSSYKQYKAEAIELLNLVGLNDFEKHLQKYPHQLSGGMLQRIIIAMAIASKPRILIADEPTTALDAIVQVQIIDLLKALRYKLKMSIILISHDLAVIKRLCDKVLVMHDGKINEIL